MKVTAFNGSPRPDGNTAYLLKRVLAPIAAAGIETEFVQVGGSGISGCRGCMACTKLKNKRCAHDDDPLNTFLAKMLESDGIILGSPSYFCGLTSEMKALIDRTGFVAAYNDRMFARKIAAGVAAHRREGGAHVMEALNRMFLMNRMIVPGSTYWNFGVGRAPGEVAADKEAAVNMQDLGETFVWLLQKLAPVI
jgi:multimeric flavodoxin WrbA